MSWTWSTGDLDQCKRSGITAGDHRRRARRRLREELIRRERRSKSFGCRQGTSGCELVRRRRSSQCPGCECRRRIWARIGRRSDELRGMRRHRASIRRRNSRRAESRRGSVPIRNRNDTDPCTKRSETAPRRRSKDTRPNPKATARPPTTSRALHNRRTDRAKRRRRSLRRRIAGHTASRPSHIGWCRPIDPSGSVAVRRAPTARCTRRRRSPAGCPPDRCLTYATAGRQEARVAARPALRPAGSRRDRGYEHQRENENGELPHDGALSQWRYQSRLNRTP